MDPCTCHAFLTRPILLAPPFAFHSSSRRRLAQGLDHPRSLLFETMYKRRGVGSFPIPPKPTVSSSSLECRLVAAALNAGSITFELGQLLANFDWKISRVTVASRLSPLVEPRPERFFPFPPRPLSTSGHPALLL